MEQLRLSYVQQRLWIEWKLQSRNHAYNNPLLYLLTGDVNPDYLERSIQYVVTKRAALRTTFNEKNGIPYQRIESHMPAKLHYVDVSSYACENKKIEVARLIDDNVRQPFHLYDPPLFRFTLLKCSHEEYKFILNIHHIVVDGYSAALLLEDISYAYQNLVEDKALTCQSDDELYKNHSVDEEFVIDDEYKKKSMDHWLGVLQDAEHEIALVRQKNFADSIFDGKRLHFTVDTKLELKKQAKLLKTTPFLFLMGVWQVLLYKYSGQSNCLVGYPIDVRGKQFHNLFGCCINNLPLISRFSENMSFDSLLVQITTQRKKDRDYEKLPMQHILEVLRRNKKQLDVLFSVSFIRANFALSGLVLPEIGCEAIPIFTNAVKDDLTLLYDEGEQLEFEIEYRINKFDEGFINQLISHFKQILACVLESPERDISSIPLVTLQEKIAFDAIYNRLNSHELPFTTYIHSFERSAKKHANRIAICDEYTQLTYDELSSLVNSMAFFLRQKGIQVNQRVAVCLSRDRYLLVCLLALQKIGAVYIPIDIEYPAERLNYVLQQSHAHAIVVNSRFSTELSFISCKIIALSELEQQIIVARKTTFISEASPSSPAYIIYTSGSTGKPKGVVVKHQSLINFISSMAMELPITLEDRLLATTTVAFDISALELYLPLYIGACVMIAPKAISQNVKNLIQSVEDYKITVLQATPASWQMILNSDWRGNTELTALCGGEALSEPLAEKLLTKVKALWNLYGPTETTIWSMLERVMPNLPISLGKPIQNTAIALLGQDLRPVPKNVMGEIYIGGEGVAAGYFERPDLTEKAFVNFPNKPNQVWYKTGDVAFLTQNNTLMYLQRRDNQIKLRGYRIELGEIESVLIKHANIQDAIVTLQHYDTNDVRLVAHYTVKNKQDIEIDKLRAYLQEFLPTYMIPAYFVQVESMPLTISGKIDRLALQARQCIELESDTYTVPHTDVEKNLHELWQRLLKISNISVNTDFFSVGGHSLLASQMVAQIENNWHVEISLEKFFSEPTISGLAKQFSTEDKTCNKIIAREKTENIPLSSAQQRFWFMSLLQEDVGQYNIAFTLEFRSPLDISKLQQSMQKIISSQKILRTIFIEDKNSFVQQVIKEVADCSLSIVACNTEHEMKDRAEHLAKVQFDLEKGPLFQFFILRSSSQQRLLCVFHHIIFDGSSIAIFAEQLLSYYVDLLEERFFPCEKQPIDYADYAIWHNNFIKMPQKQKNLDYWLQELHGHEITLLKTDRPRPQRMLFVGDECEFLLPYKVTENLRELAKLNNVTMFQMLLSAFYVLLYFECQQEDLCIGIPTDGKNKQELQLLLGCFINYLPIRINLKGNPSILEIIQRVKSTMNRALTHQDVPFDRIVRGIKADRNATINPLVNIIFNYQVLKFDFFSGNGVAVHLSRVNTHTSKCDFNLDVYDDQKNISIVIQYATVLFDSKTIQALFDKYSKILLALGNDIHAKLNELSQIFSNKSEGLFSYSEANKITENTTHHYEAPKTAQQEMIANLWQDLLKVERVGLTDNFFELGGHSLLATKLISKLSGIYQERLSLSIIFEAKNLNDFICKLPEDLDLNSLPMKKLKREREKTNVNNPSYRLSNKFLGMLYSYEKTKQPVRYNVAVCLSLEGKLKQKHLENSVMEVIGNHDAFGTYYVSDENGYAGRITDSRSQIIQKIDVFGNLNKVDIHNLIKKMSNAPFNLQQWPLWRFILITVSDTRCYLLVIAHHIVCDEWSMDILLKKIAEHYNQCKIEKIKQTSMSLKKYNDIMLVEQTDTGSREKFLTYWREQLDGFAWTVLPKQSAQEEENYTQQTHYLSKQTTNLIKASSAKYKVTPFICLFAIFNVLLVRYTREFDVCLNSIISNRNDGLLDNDIGFFTETLLLRTQFSPDINFPQTIFKVSEVIYKALENAKIPYADVIAQYRSLKNQKIEMNPQILFVMNHEFSSLYFNELDSKVTTPINAGGEYEIVFILRELADGRIKFIVDYKTHYSDEFITELCENYISLVESCLKYPLKSILKHDLKIDKRLDEVMAHIVEYQSITPVTVSDLLDKIIKAYPDNVAISHNRAQVSFSELGIRTQKIANTLLNQYKEILVNAEANNENIIAICATPSIELVITILAIIQIGAAYLPIDKQAPVERIAYILEDCRACMLVTDEMENHLSLSATLVPLKSLFNQTITSTVPAQAYDSISPTNLAYIIYTSGSTGVPKGVAVEHHSLINLMNNLQDRLRITSQDKMLQFSSIGFDASIWEIFLTLLSAATLYIPTESERLVGKPLEKFIAEHHITTAILPPAVLHQLESHKVASLSKLAVGGDKVTVDLVRRWAHGRMLYNAYGPTEATICVLLSELLVESSVVPLGSPIDKTNILLLDETSKPVPLGCIGEICIIGESLARGYVGKASSNEAFTEFNNHDACVRMYRTGDLAQYVSNSTLIFLGRKDRQIKIRGLRIEPSEVENCLIQLDGIDQCTVVLHKEDALVAYYKANKPINPQEIRAYLSSKLPPYMLPTSYECLKEFPLTSNGKIDINALSVFSITQQSTIGKQLERPLTGIESDILECWQNILNSTELTVDQNFFALGGNSLQIMQILATLNARFSLKLDMKTFFNHPTIAQLAKCVEETSSAMV